MKKKSFLFTLLTLLIGMIAGALLAVLFTPIGGKNLRGIIIYQVKKALYKIKILFLHLVHFHGHRIEKGHAYQASQAVIDQTISKAKNLLKEAKTLAAQLDDNSA